MCGIFGLIRNQQALHPERASAAFIELGHLAVERGRDAAGVAFTGHKPRTTVTGVKAAQVKARETTIDNVHIIKDTCAFEDLWDDELHMPALTEARVALGHTRWATQGKRTARENASPLVVGSLVGTHNGDIAIESVPDRWKLPIPHGSTDTERLYQAFDRARRDRREIVKVMESIEGRAALAWVDRHHTERVYLARAALSPLATAWDAEGNLYWASNPRWFRDIDAKFGHTIGFRDITIVREGSLLTVSIAGDEPLLDDLRSFTPQARLSDTRLSDFIVWRGFDEADMAADQGQTKHKVARSRTVYSGGSTTGSTFDWGRDRAASASGSGSRASTQDSLPWWNDDLDAVNTASFRNSESALDAALDAEDAEDETVYDEDALLAEQHRIIEDEVADAVLAWAEEGARPDVVHRFVAATTPTAVEALVREFRFSGTLAVEKFREELLAWSENDPQYAAAARDAISDDEALTS